MGNDSHLADYLGFFAKVILHKKREPANQRATTDFGSNPDTGFRISPDLQIGMTDTEVAITELIFGINTKA